MEAQQAAAELLQSRTNSPYTGWQRWVNRGEIPPRGGEMSRLCAEHVR